MKTEYILFNLSILKSIQACLGRAARFFDLLPLIALSICVVSLSANSADNQGAKATVLITGANRGLGLEMARQFHDDGYHVIGTARRPDRAAKLQALGVQVEQLDVVDTKSVAALAERLLGQKIDILINNAGYYGQVPVGKPQPTIDELNPDDVLRVIEVNTMGPLRVTQALLKNLRASNTRKVINISTRQSILNGGLSQGGDAYGYRISKTALNMVTKVIASDLADERFIVISLAPGWVKTDMGTQLAELTPEQSIRDVKRVIETLSAEHSGGFWFHNGNQLPY